MKEVAKKYSARWQELGVETHEVDDWSVGGRNIMEENVLASIKNQLENIGCIVVEHWHYRGGRAPTRFVCEDFDDFCDYLQMETRPGDAIDVYEFPHNKEGIAKGLCPDPMGRVPKRGAY